MISFLRDSLSISLSHLATCFFFIISGWCLGGCSSLNTYNPFVVNSHRVRILCTVNSFGNYDMTGKTFFILSGDTSVSSSDPEFLEYASYVTRCLTRAGAHVVDSALAADICILINYGISDASYTETVPIPIWGQTGISSITTRSVTSSAGGVAAVASGNTVTGSLYGNSTTTSVSSVTPSYGVTGYNNVSRRVERYRRFLNVYSYDIRSSKTPKMLWKTNTMSDGSSNDLRRVVPIMAYGSRKYFGQSSDRPVEVSTYEDNEQYVNWKHGRAKNDNDIYYPIFDKSSADPDEISISRITKHATKTEVEFVYHGLSGDFRIDRPTYIEYDDQEFPVIGSENITLGRPLRIVEENTRFSLIFPALPPNADIINIIEGVRLGCRWYGVRIQ